MAVLIAALVMPTLGLAAVTAPDLRTAGDYALVANTTITNTGVTLIDGNLALVGPSVTGFGPGVITGTRDIGNAAASTAEADVLAAHHAATGAAPATNSSSSLGGKTFTPGIYDLGTAATLNGILTLDGQGQTNPVFIFQIGTTLTTGTASKVVLKDGAAGCAVFWAVGTSATIGTATSLQGNLMALVSITMNTGASIGVGGGRNGGRAFAQNGAITLDTNTVISPSGGCAAAPAPTPTPKPTASPTPTPTRSQSTPTPTTPPTPGPTGAPTPRTTLGPTPTPTPALPSQLPGVTPTGAAPTPLASSPGASLPASATPSSNPSPSGAVVLPVPAGSPPPPASAPPNVFVIPTGDEGTITLDGGIVGFIGPFVVPGFLGAASGFLIILLMLAQALGALAWLPVVRRRVGSFGIGGQRQA